MLDQPGGVEAQFLGQFNLIEHLAIDLGVRLPGVVGHLQVEGTDTEFHGFALQSELFFRAEFCDEIPADADIRRRLWQGHP